MAADTIAMMIAKMNEIADHARAAGDWLRGAAGVPGKTLLVSPGWKREMLAKAAKSSAGPSPLDAYGFSTQYQRLAEPDAGWPDCSSAQHHVGAGH